MDGFITDEIINSVKEILESPEKREKIVEINYEIAKRHYSYSLLQNRLNSIMFNFFGEPLDQSESKSSDKQHVIYLNIATQPSFDNRVFDQDLRVYSEMKA